MFVISITLMSYKNIPASFRSVTSIGKSDVSYPFIHD